MTHARQQCEKVCTFSASEALETREVIWTEVARVGFGEKQPVSKGWKG